MTVLKQNIPSVGDVVTKVILSTNKKFVQMTFDTGKKLVVELDIVQTGTKKSIVTGVGKKIIKKPVIVSSESRKPNKLKQSKVSESVNNVYKNSPEDERYKRQVVATLAKMEGKSPKEIQELLGDRQVINESLGDGPKIPKDQIDRTSESSEKRSERLAAELARMSGAKTESFFGGKDSISVGNV